MSKVNIKLSEERGELDLTRRIEELNQKVKKQKDTIHVLIEEVTNLKTDLREKLMINKSHQELNGKLSEKIKKLEEQLKKEKQHSKMLYEHP